MTYDAQKNEPDGRQPQNAGEAPSSAPQCGEGPQGAGEEAQIVPKNVVKLAALYERMNRGENIIITGVGCGKTWAQRIASAKLAKFSEAASIFE